MFCTLVFDLISFTFKKNNGCQESVQILTSIFIIVVVRSSCRQAFQIRSKARAPLVHEFLLESGCSPIWRQQCEAMRVQSHSVCGTIQSSWFRHYGNGNADGWPDSFRSCLRMRLQANAFELRSILQSRSRWQR